MAKDLTLAEYKKFYDKYAKNAYGLGWITMFDKYNEICNEFSKVKIDITDEESALLKNFLAFSKQSKQILSDMDEMMKRIDDDVAFELKQKQKETGRSSLERMIKEVGNA